MLGSTVEERAVAPRGEVRDVDEPALPHLQIRGYGTLVIANWFISEQTIPPVKVASGRGGWWHFYCVATVLPQSDTVDDHDDDRSTTDWSSSDEHRMRTVGTTVRGWLSIGRSNWDEEITYEEFNNYRCKRTTVLVKRDKCRSFSTDWRALVTQYYSYSIDWEQQKGEVK